jgi:hypothetical protein
MDLPPEIWTMVGNNIDDPGTWKSWILVCRMFSDMNTDEKILKHSNPLWSLIQRYPEEDWDWHAISTNPWTTFEIVMNNLDKPFDWSLLVSHLKFPLEFLYDAIGIYDHWNDMDPYDKSLYKFYYKTIKNIKDLSENPWITKPFLLYTSELKWDLSEIARNIDFDDIDFCEIWETSPLQWGEGDFVFNRHMAFEHENFLMLSDDKRITLDFFKTHLTKDWYYDLLSENPSITVEFIKLTPTSNWDWSRLSQHRDICNMFRAFPDKPWDMEFICENRHLNLQLIKDFPDRTWNINDFSLYGDITLCDVLDNPAIGWNYINVLSNRNIPFTEFITEFNILNDGVVVYKKDSAQTSIEGGLIYTGPDFDKINAEYPLYWNTSIMAFNEKLHWTDVNEDWDFSNLACNWFGRRRYMPTVVELKNRTSVDLKLLNTAIYRKNKCTAYNHEIYKMVYELFMNELSDLEDELSELEEADLDDDAYDFTEERKEQYISIILTKLSDPSFNLRDMYSMKFRRNIR